MNSQYPFVRGKCDESCLELVLYSFPKQTVLNVSHIIGMKPITFENTFSVKKRAFISARQVNYVEDIIFKFTQQILAFQGRR